MKSHYDLLGVEPTADLETIKKAFRREIARYHPDKVTHLGPEFQEMASTRAAELTAAYKTLTDPHARASYDDEVHIGHGHGPISAPASPHVSRARDRDDDEVSNAAAAETHAGRRFEQERAGRDEIVRRAVLGRVREVLRQVVGESEAPAVRGFDLAYLSKARPSLFKRNVPPSVLVRLAPVIDGAAAADAYSAAARARLEQKPLVLLLMGDGGLAPASELGRAIEEQRRKFPAVADTIVPVPVDIRDWTAKIPANAPESVRVLMERLRNFAS